MLNRIQNMINERLTEENTLYRQRQVGYALVLRGVFALVCFLCTQLASATSLTGARVWNGPDYTHLVLDVAAKVNHKVSMLSSPDRLVLDIDNTDLKTSWSRLKLKSTPIKGIRSARRGKHNLRVVLDLKNKIVPKSFMLPPSKQYGNRLVVELHDAGRKTKPAMAENTVLMQGKRDIVVMIDPGHGGEDPGAIGPSKNPGKRCCAGYRQAT